MNFPFPIRQECPPGACVCDRERLLGWLYVGDVDPAFRARLEASKKPALDPAPFLGRMPQG